MGTIELSRRDKVNLAFHLGLIALILVAPTVVLAWVISWRLVGLGLGVPVFPVVALWSKARMGIRSETAMRLGWYAGAILGLVLRFVPGRQTVVAVVATLAVGAVDAVTTGTRRLRAKYRDDARGRQEHPVRYPGWAWPLGLLTLASTGGLITWAVSGLVVGLPLGAVTCAVVALRRHPHDQVTLYGWASSTVAGVLLRLFPVVWILAALTGMVIDDAIHLLRLRANARAERALEILAGRG